MCNGRSNFNLIFSSHIERIPALKINSGSKSTTKRPESRPECCPSVIIVNFKHVFFITEKGAINQTLSLFKLNIQDMVF